VYDWRVTEGPRVFEHIWTEKCPGMSVSQSCSDHSSFSSSSSRSITGSRGGSISFLAKWPPRYKQVLQDEERKIDDR
jgi:hypothetical protein